MPHSPNYGGGWREVGRMLVAAVAYTICTVLTDSGIQFTDNKPVNAEDEAEVAAYWAGAMTCACTAGTRSNGPASRPGSSSA